jgi:hypothetical protein
MPCNVYIILNAILVCEFMQTDKCHYSRTLQLMNDHNGRFRLGNLFPVSPE